MAFILTKNTSWTMLFRDLTFAKPQFRGNIRRDVRKLATVQDSYRRWQFLVKVWVLGFQFHLPMSYPPATPKWIDPTSTRTGFLYRRYSEGSTNTLESMWLLVEARLSIPKNLVAPKGCFGIRVLEDVASQTWLRVEPPSCSWVFHEINHPAIKG